MESGEHSEGLRPPPDNLRRSALSPSPGPHRAPSPSRNSPYREDRQLKVKPFNVSWEKPQNDKGKAAKERHLASGGEEGGMQKFQRKKPCGLCGYSFFAFPGVITYKSILEIRGDWGDADSVDKLNKSNPTFLYNQVKLCVYCSQFFDKNSDKTKKNGG
jgi:hypothetical protein